MDGRIFMEQKSSCEIYDYKGDNSDPVFLKEENGIVTIPVPQGSLSLT